MTWNSPNLPSGIDDFTRKQEPNPQPVDDLSRFVLDRIRKAENEPRVDGIPQNYYKDRMAIAYRYADKMRHDMIAFRRIVQQYVEYAESDWPHDQVLLSGFRPALQAIANRWSDHPDFKAEWGLQ